MNELKNLIVKLLSLGVSPGMEGAKRLAIQVATFDGIATIATMMFYLVYTYMRGDYPLDLFFACGLVVMSFGMWCLRQKHHDVGRFILHLTALAQIFVTTDIAGENSGYEFYYFTSVTFPFITFTNAEKKKGYFLTFVSLAVLLSQQLLGTGLIMEPIGISAHDKFVSIFIVMLFMISFLSVARWQIDLSQKEIRKQQGELIHASNLRALGEMAGGIAHEINNPLQTLSLQSQALKNSLATLDSVPTSVKEQLDTVDNNILRIAKLIKGLRDLTRDVSNDPTGYFTVREMLDDVLSVSSERLKNLGIQLIIHGDRNLAVNGHMVQISQVLINLLNNSIDALETRKEKWITIGMIEKNDRVQLIVTDSGPGIPKEVVKNLMMPFFTTKGAGKGTGLGLSISKSIIEKNGGKFYYDPSSIHTRFVIELPGVTESA